MAKKTKAELEQELQTLKKELDEANSLVQQLEETSKNSVPKEKLKQESAAERINWFYNDLEGWERVGAKAISIFTIGFVVFGVYWGVTKLGGESNASEYLGLVLSAVLSILGFNIEGKAMKLPSEKLS